MTHHSLWFNTMLGQFWWPTIYYDSKQCQDSCDDPPFTMIQSNVRWQLQWPTSTGLPHDLGENPISPFVCGQVKLSIQLCQWHGFGVQWVVLSSERCTKHHHRIHKKSEIINTQKTSHVFTRMPGEWVTRKMSHLVFTCTPGESYHRQLGFLLLSLWDIFQVLINSLVCWFCTFRESECTLQTLLIWLTWNKQFWCLVFSVCVPL